jgi:AcrR family transcriptional regulator
MQLEGEAGFSISEACDAARISRAGFYRHFDDHAPQQSATELRHEIQQICLNSRCYGYRRVTAALRAQGRIVSQACTAIDAQRTCLLNVAIVLPTGSVRYRGGHSGRSAAEESSTNDAMQHCLLRSLFR